MRELTSKRQAFVNEYCTNGYNASKAYRKAYPDCKNSYQQAGSRLLLNVVVKAAIVEFEAKTAAKAERTIESLDKMYQEAYVLAKICRQPAAMNGSVTGIARLYGMDKDAGGSEDSPKPLSLKDIAMLRSMARAVTDAEIAKPEPKVHKVG